MARVVVWVCAIADAMGLCLMCSASSSASGPGVTGWLLYGAALLVGNAVTAAYAIQQGLPFAWLMERKWKAVCQGIGFVGAGRLQFKPRVAFDPISSFQKGRWERQTIYPKLREVSGTRDSFTGIVYPFAGQTLEQYNDNAPAYALAFNVRFVGFDRTENGLLRIRVGEVPVPGTYNYGQVAQHASRVACKPQTAHVTQPAQSSLRVINQAVPSVYAAVAPDYRVANVWAEELALLRAVPMARDTDGNVWHMPIEEQHVLIAAVTGGGKGSWIWSLVFGLEPARRAGLVKLWGIDPKLIELSMGRDFFEYYADNDQDSVVLLEEAVKQMHERGRLMQGMRRKFVPSIQTPLIVVVIDEIGYLSALMPDKKLRERAYAAITTLLNKGRAPGFAVVSATQDVRKEVLNNRDGYSIRIAGRMPAPMCDLVLGDGAYAAGALVDRIPAPPAGSGVAYVLDEMTMEPRLVRAAWCSDDDIRGMLQGALLPPYKPVSPSDAVKDEDVSGQLGWDGQPLPNWQYRVE